MGWQLVKLWLRYQVAGIVWIVERIKATGIKKLSSEIGLDKNRYHGIEWDARSVEEAQKNHIEIIQGDLNAVLPFDENQFSCVFALSVPEHLLKPCHFLRESHRVLTQGGKLILLTPNIST